jgi:benzoyl-CoA reductase/2-hydroxyglutaryl-CoA dehydratase subunit BcrC/BadD/HgdB
MNIPKITGTRAVEFFKKEIQKLVDVLAEYRGSEIKDSNLVEAVGIYNESRSLMSELYELRKEANLALTGALVYKIVQSSQSMPKKAFNRKLKEFLSDAKKRAEQPSQSIGPRIMIVGSLLPDLQIVQIIEDAGALIVSDDLCFGNRYFDGNIEKGDDLLKAISQRYLNKAPCARMKETGLRLERVESQIEEFKVDGIIYLSLKFCDNHLYDYPVYREYFREIRVPVLQIEEDFTGGNIGQIRTRIEAFIEML